MTTPSKPQPHTAPARPNQPRVGVVLGAGGARGWSHIGVLEELHALGVRPNVICGCSSGALVGASYACGKLPALADFASALTWRGMLGFFDLAWRGGGLIEGRWLVDFFQKHFEDIAIEDAPIAFGAVATDLHTGREAWLTRGSIIEAVRASVSLPGLMTPIRIGERWMVDGALVDPLPVALCRALGADVIIGVNPGGGLVGQGPPLEQTALAREPLQPLPPASAASASESSPPWHAPDLPAAAEGGAPQAQSSWLAWLTAGLAGGAKPTAPSPLRAATVGAQSRPGYVDVIGNSFFIVQDFVARMRLAADPVDLLITPDTAHIGVMDFHRGGEAIAAGRAAIAKHADALRALGAAKEESQPAA